MHDNTCLFSATELLEPSGRVLLTKYWFQAHAAPWMVYIYGHLGDGRQSNWATANWATHFGQLGDNIGRVIKDVNVGKIFEIISF